MRLSRWSIVLLSGIGCGDDTTEVPAASSSDGSGVDETSSSDTTGNASADETSAPAESSTTGEPAPIPGDGPFGGGSRLRPVVAHGDGAARLLHWYDADLGIECEFARDASGELRCLPVRMPGVKVGYSDDGCNAGVLQVAACGNLPSFVRSDAVDSADCDNGPRQITFRRGGPIPAPDDLWDFDAGSGCKSAGLPSGNHYAIERVDDGDFLAATIVDEIGDAPLGVRSIVAEDGAWERVQPIDAATGRLCSKGYQLVDGAPVDRCTIDTGPTYAFAYDTPECDGTPLLRLPDDGSCDVPTFTGYGAEWWELGPRHEGDAWGISASECTSYPFDPDVDALFQRGAAIDPPIFADYVSVPVPADARDRLQPLGIEIAGVPTLLTRTPGWYDALLDAPCEAVDLPEGGQVCAHDTTQELPTAWGDAECSETPLTRSNTQYVPPIVVRVEYDGCRPVAQDAQAVFGEWKGDVFESDRETGECAPSPDARALGFLQLGNSVQLADLPPLVVETLESP